MPIFNLLSLNSFERIRLYLGCFWRQPCYGNRPMPDIHRELSSVHLASRWYKRLLASRNQISEAAAVFCGSLRTATSPAQTTPATLPNVQFTSSGFVLRTAPQDDAKGLI